MARNQWKKEYDYMLDMPHHVSKKHPPMPRENRAAQFAPFAALTGYEDAISETARLTDAKIELDENAKELLDKKFQQLSQHFHENVEVDVTYFQKDEHKDGGTYLHKKGTMKKINSIYRELVFEDDTRISMDCIIDIEEAF